LSEKKEEAPRKSAHLKDFEHFKKVSFWWYIFFVGAVAAVLAEFLDWWGKPWVDWWL
jgi:hypothetical protein